jgi:hypothetical protein
MASRTMGSRTPRLEAALVAPDADVGAGVAPVLAEARPASSATVIKPHVFRRRIVLSEWMPWIYTTRVGLLKELK